MPSVPMSSGSKFLCANDHLVFSQPWLDGPTALAAVVDASGTMTLATTVSNPVVRGPALTAKTLGAIDILSGGRLVVGVGPGSSERDYIAAGLPFEERWKRFNEVIEALRGTLDSRIPKLPRDILLGWGQSLSNRTRFRFRVRRFG